MLPAALLAALAAACTGELSPGDNAAAGGTNGVAGNGPTGGGAVEMPPVGYDPATLDPGHIPLHRLTNSEYNNSVADLLGTTLRPAEYFQAQTGTGFDTNAGPLTAISAANALAYFDAAKALADDVFANPALKAKVVTCTPAAAGDTACADTIIKTFGRLAWRRPLEATEAQQLLARYSEALTTLGKDHEGAISHVLRIMLTSAPFLYFIEIDPSIQAAAAEKRALTGYELASRLSYALWGSTPDATLLDAAEAGTLTDLASLSAQVDRLLADPAKGQRFLQTFFNQWFHINNLGGHQVDEQLYPAWNEGMREAMFNDARGFFASFVSGGRSWTELLTAPLVPAPGLEAIYGADPPGLRKGFLGLPAYLTAQSVPTRTAPTFRGKVVLEAVLCTTLAVPPGLVIPDLEEAGGADETNIRKKLEAHRTAPDCAACHAVLDPIGLGLENFDAIGRYRTAYENGDQVDTSGSFQGQAFNGIDELIPILTADPQYRSCPSEKVLTFALRRGARPQDAPYLKQLTDGWNAGTVRDLVQQLVASDTFRFRKLPQSAL